LEEIKEVFSATHMEVNARGFFDSVILLRKRLDNSNPAKKESQDTIQCKSPIA